MSSESQQTPPADTDPAMTEAVANEAKDNVVVTRHTVTVNGQELHYTATAGTMVLREEAQKDGVSEGHKPRARVFFVAYTLDSEQPTGRPLTFSFNGGPGSSSVWLHLGLLGPRRVVMGDAGALKGPPWGLTDNDFTCFHRPIWCLSTPSAPAIRGLRKGRSPAISTASALTSIPWPNSSGCIPPARDAGSRPSS